MRSSRRVFASAFAAAITAALLFFAGDFTFASGGRLSFMPGVSDAEFRPRAMPAAAPDTFEKASTLSFPDANRMFRLRVTRRGRFRGPDGGRVDVFRGGAYTWRRRDGTKVTFFRNGTWKIERRGHKLVYFPYLTCGPTIYWYFPDKSRLERCAMRGRRAYRYFYKRDYPDGGESGYQIFAPGYWVKNHAKVGRFRFHYSDRWRDFVQAYRAWRKRDEGETRFFKKMDELFGFRHRGEIPVVFTDTIAQKRAAAGRSNVGAGGTGGYNEITICCGRNRKPYSRDPAVRAVRMRAENFTKLLLHETIHNLQQHACRVVQRDRGTPGRFIPDQWFVEGVAEYGAMLFEKRALSGSIKRFYKYLDAGRMSTLASLNYADKSNYVGGRAIIDYMVRRHGARSIRVYHESRCGGKTKNQAMRIAAGKTPEEIHRDMLAYFRANRKQFLALAKKLELHGLHTPAYLYPDAERRIPAKALSPLRIKSIPDPAKAFALNIGALLGKYRGRLRGPDGQKVVLFADGVYQIRGPNYVIAYWPDGRRAFEFGGNQRIFFWATGRARWTLRGAGSAYFNGEEIRYYDAQNRLIEKNK